MSYFNSVTSYLMPKESLHTQHFLRQARDCNNNIEGIANGVAATVLSTANTVTYLGSAVLRLTFISKPETLEEGFVNRVVQQIGYAACGVRDAFRSIAFVVLFSVPYLAIAVVTSIFCKEVTVFTYAIAGQDWTKLPAAPSRELTEAQKDLKAAQEDKQKAEEELAKAKRDHTEALSKLPTKETVDNLTKEKTDLETQLAASASFTTPEATPTDLGINLAKLTSDAYNIRTEQSPTADQQKLYDAFFEIITDENVGLSALQNHTEALNSYNFPAVDKIDEATFKQIRESLAKQVKTKIEAAELPEKLADLTAKLNTAQADAGKVADLEKQITDLTAKLNTAQADAGKVAGLEEQITDLTAERDAAQADAGKVADLEKQITELTAERNAAQADASKVADLEEQITDLTAERDAAQADAGKVADLEKQITELTAERDTAQAHAGKVANLEEQITELTTERDAAQADASKVAGLEKQIKDLNNVAKYRDSKSKSQR